MVLLHKERTACAQCKQCHERIEDFTDEMRHTGT